MPTYRIGIIRSQYATVLIDAESEEEAEQKYNNGEFDYPQPHDWENNDEYIHEVEENEAENLEIAL